VSPALAATGGSLRHRIARLLEPGRPSAHTMPGPAAAWALTALVLVAIAALAVRGARAEYSPQAGYPAVSRASIWADTVKLGDIPIEVRGLGTLTSPTTAEIKIAEVQAKNLQVGQPAAVGFQRTSFAAKGKVTRIEPGVHNGTVTVDVQVEAVPANIATPPAQVDGVVKVDNLTNVVYVGRPVIQKAESEGTLFRIEPDGGQAVRVKVQFGRASVNLIEVRSGLQPGDKVILSDMSAYEGHERVYLK
jgi:bla regulator protein blaR1